MYMNVDDGTLAGPKHAVKRAIYPIQQFGPSLWLWIDTVKCELFSRSDMAAAEGLSSRFHGPNLEILGTSIIMIEIPCAKAGQGRHIAVPAVGGEFIRS